MVLALKYQLVASSMEHYITGNLDTLRNTKLTKAFFSVLLLMVTFSFVVYIIFCIYTTKGKQLKTDELKFILSGVVLLLTLFLSYFKSLVQMERAVRKTEENKSNRCMQVVNLTLFGVLLTVQIFYAITWDRIHNSIITVSLCRMIVELSVKFVLLYLVTQFGAAITVKSFVHANGDLIIMGSD